MESQEFLASLKDIEANIIPRTMDQKMEMLNRLSDQLGITDEYLLTRLKEWIEQAVYQWPKWEILTDWKAITKMAELIFKLKWKLKSDTVINIVNPFQKPENILDAY